MAKSTSTRQQPTHVQIANRAFEIYISRGLQPKKRAVKRTRP